LLSNWLEQHAALLEALAAAVQALAAAAIVGLTWKIVCVTKAYTEHTKKYTELTASAVALTKQQFDREWLPQLHISLTLTTMVAPQPPVPRLIVHNLSKPSVVITRLFLATDEQANIKSFPVDFPVMGLNTAESEDITPYVRNLITSVSHEQRWSGVLKINVGFSVANIPRPGEWVAYQVTTNNGYITEARKKSPVVLWRTNALAQEQ